MKDILPFTLPIKRFTWDRDKRILTAFASDLGPRWLNRVWADACDVGLRVQGRNESKLFTLAREEWKDGDLVAWHFTEFCKPLRPEWWRMTVFNT